MSYKKDISTIRRVLTADSGEVLQALRSAQALISDPARFCKHAAALDSSGKVTRPDSPTAVCWCPLGAIRQVSGYRAVSDRALLDMAHAISDISDYEHEINGWVDDSKTTHAHVMAMFDIAIAYRVATGDRTR